MLAERCFGKDALRFLAGVGQRDNRVAPNRDEPSVGAVLNHKGFGAALRHPATEAGEDAVPIGFLPFGRDQESANY